MGATSVIGRAGAAGQGTSACGTGEPPHERHRVRDAGDTDGERFVRLIYDKHGSALVRFAARLLDGDRTRAEDVLQEAVIRAWRHIGLLGQQEEDGVRPWLFTVVRNLVIDDHRARLVRPVSTCTLDDVVVPVDDDVERTLMRQVVHDALDDLTPRQRQILHHMFFQDRSVAETAEVLGIAQGTVKSRTYSAVRALKLALHTRGVRR
ncbi:sigma-70 family RNA polymerase sigma factor [Streptomyces heilongjiangensis]|uniref:Sigma-70 family RNA polymerase sigma factor n=1 Tax=Streptomyces heilongjiangensis TaxID=945052 RepID=A0ABW1BES3_9ACTN|nr:sigma-70 family RNA polymerase sigma factor [Streptomyces heilongjiangensis]MDC2951032.1 sigma-70 family RNA polymerase sigma factor [Streptomyces heilongjiangensis]